MALGGGMLRRGGCVTCSCPISCVSGVRMKMKTRTKTKAKTRRKRAARIAGSCGSSWPEASCAAAGCVACS